VPFARLLGEWTRTPVSRRSFLGQSAAAVGVLAAGYALTRRLRHGFQGARPVDRTGRDSWRMPPLSLLQRPAMSAGRKIGMGALRLYLGVATILVIIKIAQLALGH